MDFPTLVFLTMAILVFLLVFVVAGLVLSARAFNQLAELTKFLSDIVAQNATRIRRVERRDQQHQEDHDKRI